MPDFDGHDAILMIAASETSPDLYYASGFLAPDDFIYFETPRQKVLLMSDLEIDRARAESRADRVLSISKYEEVAGKTGAENPTALHALDVALREHGIRSLLVPRKFPIEAADFLRGKGFHLDFRKGSILPERETKSGPEIEHILEVQRHTEAAMERAIQAIRESEVRDETLYRDGQPLTAEAIKRIVAFDLMERECIAQHTIVACGDLGCDPHNRGTGPLKADRTIILDIFPRSSESGYYGDLTRTVVRGRASDAVRKIYDAVARAQEVVFGRLKVGADGVEIHQAVMDHFNHLGYRTGEVDGRMQGFFHGTGHGVGLEIHEPPRISRRGDVLRDGHVVTVEPGLYYPGVGAVRTEDLVVVTEGGYHNLTSCPKVLEV
ncbi:MAG: aminopeptidase P family protein [Candidatus Latescibacteria bacterium]|nr:aminopeptidase P family protein [Candidatus Latescibacterota bacterium]